MIWRPGKAPTRRRRRRRWLLTLFVISVILGLGLATVLYPLPHRDVIDRQADNFGVDPWLVAAVIKAESRFDPGAQSHRGAVGLMQIMPSTGIWAAQQMGHPDVGNLNLHDPETNIAIGTWYLAHLLRQFQHEEVALAAYNAGQGRVAQWLPDRSTEGSLEWIRFAETRDYVDKVLRDVKIYRLLYLWPWPDLFLFAASGRPVLS